MSEERQWREVHGVRSESMAEVHRRIAEDEASWPSSTPPARDSGRDEAREAVARWLQVHDGSAPSAWDRLLNDKSRAVWRTYADELLALPELGALLRDGEQR